MQKSINFNRPELFLVRLFANTKKGKTGVWNMNSPVFELAQSVSESKPSAIRLAFCNTTPPQFVDGGWYIVKGLCRSGEIPSMTITKVVSPTNPRIDFSVNATDITVTLVAPDFGSSNVYGVPLCVFTGNLVSNTPFVNQFTEWATQFSALQFGREVFEETRAKMTAIGLKKTFEAIARAANQLHIVEDDITLELHVTSPAGDKLLIGSDVTNWVNWKRKKQSLVDHFAFYLGEGHVKDVVNAYEPKLRAKFVATNTIEATEEENVFTIITNGSIANGEPVITATYDVETGDVVLNNIVNPSRNQCDDVVNDFHARFQPLTNVDDVTADLLDVIDAFFARQDAFDKAKDEAERAENKSKVKAAKAAYKAAQKQQPVCPAETIVEPVEVAEPIVEQTTEQTVIAGPAQKKRKPARKTAAPVQELEMA